MILLNILNKLSEQEKKDICKYFKINSFNLKQNRRVRLNKSFKFDRLLSVIHDIVNTNIKRKDIFTRYSINEQSFYREARTLKTKITELQK